MIILEGMETNFKKLQVWSYPNTVENEASEDAKYWKNLEFPVTTQTSGYVTHVEFSPLKPHDYLVTTSTRVILYSSRSHKPLATRHRFPEFVHSASFRPDGLLFVVGSDDSLVRVLHGKQFNQEMKGHSGPVRMTKFLDNFKVFSGSDDKTVKLWDVGTKSQIMSYNEHTDYVRCGAKGSLPEMFLTGSYDNTAKLFDSRTQSSVMTVNHGKAIESVLMHPSSGMFATAGENVIKLWDIMAGGKLIGSFSNHHKTIKSLSFCSFQQRLVSASLDRHVKFYDLTTNKVVHTLDYPSSLLSLAIAPDDSMLAVGSTDKMLTVRKRMSQEEISIKYDERRKQKKRNHSGKVLKVDVASDEPSEVLVAHKKREYLEKYNVYLKKFNHSKALDAVMRPCLKSKHPEVAFSVMQELMRRNTLKPALAGRTDEDLSVILLFLLKNLSSRFMSSVVDIFSMVLDVYEDGILGMPLSMKQIVKIFQASKDRRNFDFQAFELVGMIKPHLNTTAVLSPESIN